MADLALDRIPDPDVESGRKVSERAGAVLRPRGALERLDDLAVWVAEWQRTHQPSIGHPAAIVFFADHGVAGEGVSAHPAEVTRAMLGAVEAGVATVSVMASNLGVELRSVDVGVGRPTGNLRLEPALDRDRFASCLQAGREAVRALDTDLLVLVLRRLAAKLIGGVTGDILGACEQVI